MSSQDDRPTPPDPHRVARVPRPEPRDAADKHRPGNDAASVERRLRPAPAQPPPLPDRPQERKQTPVSGGIEAQPSQVELARRARVEAETQSPASFPPAVERRQGPAPVSVAPGSKAPTRGDWAKLRFKLASAAVGGLVLVIGALAFYLVTYFNARAEAQKATKKVEVVATSQDKADDRQTTVEKYLVAAAARNECLERQLRDALARGTGHVITSLPTGTTVLWVEQNQPKAVPRTLWAAPTWFTIETCPAAPAPPKPPP